MKLPVKPYSIYSRIIITGLIPLALFSLLMCYYIISSQRAELLANLQDTGRIAAHQISENTAFALYSGDRESLDSLSYVALEIPSVTGVLFYNRKDNQIITIGDIGFAAGVLPKDFNRESPFYLNGYWYFYSDIISDRTPIMDYDEAVEYEPDRIGWVLLALTDKILLQKEHSFTLITFTVIFLGLLLSFWLSIRIGRTVSEPIQKITRVVADMEAGDLDKVAPEEGTIELGKLARGINGLAASVRESNQLMQSEINRATSQLKDALAELEDAMRAKDQFLARMSHELRTPLTAVLGFSNMLFTEKSASNRQEQLRVIQRCSTVLLTMIDDVLDFSKAEQGGFSFNNSSFALDKFIEDLTALFRLQAEEKGLKFDIVLEKEVPKTIYGDSVRLAQVISNLVNNAIKFTDSGSVEVFVGTVDSQENHDHLKFVVSDTGKGIVKEKIPTLFEPFTQEDTSINRRYGGSGLGLSIAKKLVNAMDGEIVIDSEVNCGTTVIFTCQFIKNITGVEPSLKRLETSDFTKKDKVLSGLSILLAEDNEFNQQFLVKLLGRHGADCSIAQNGLEAINRVKSNLFDVILMDLHMPIVDGMEATKTLVEQNDHCPPIIGLTADITKAEQKKLISLGAKSVQLKPIDEVQLVNTILKVLGLDQKILKFSGEGMLSSVLPVADLKRAIDTNLDSLDACLHADQRRSIRPLIHDLMGFCGLYGMSGLREIVLELKASYASLDNKRNLQQVKRIRKYVNESPIFK